MFFHRLKNELDRAVFSHPGDRDPRRFAYFVMMAALYYAGFYWWSYFFNLGLMQFSTADWYEKSRAFEAMRQALEAHRLPYHTTSFLSIWHRDKRFLAMPHIVFSPQLLLLRTLDIGQYLLFSIRLFYSLGFYGCLLIAKRRRLSIAAAYCVLLLFNFNGYVVSHLGVGHTEWFSYFLLPYFFYFAMLLVETDRIALPSMGIAFVQFAMLLQGGFHFVIWCMMFLALMWMFHPRRSLLLALASVSIQTLLLGAVRIGPALLTFGGQQLEYVAGYETPQMLIEALVVIRDVTAPVVKPLFSPQPIAWWEYDAYVSGLGLFFMGYFGIWRRRFADRTRPATRFAEFDPPMLVLFLLSVGHLYFVLFYETHFPVIGNAERAPSRFIAMPEVFLIFLAGIWFQRFLESRSGSMKAAVRMGTYLGAIAATFLLWTHFRLWSVSRIDQSGIMPPTFIPGDFQPTLIEGDLKYIAIVRWSIAITAMSLVFWLLFLGAIARHEAQRRQARARQPEP